MNAPRHIGRSIDVMTSRPGLYVVIARAPSPGGVVDVATLVDVDGAGTCYEVKMRDPALPRAGTLRNGLWKLEQIVAIHGPFSRAEISHVRIPWPGAAP